MNEPKTTSPGENPKNSERGTETNQEFDLEVRRLKEMVQQEFQDLNEETQVDIDKIARELEDLGDDNFIVSDAGLSRLEEIRSKITALKVEFDTVSVGGETENKKENDKTNIKIEKLLEQLRIDKENTQKLLDDNKLYIGERNHKRLSELINKTLDKQLKRDKEVINDLIKTPNSNVASEVINRLESLHQNWMGFYERHIQDEIKDNYKELFNEIGEQYENEIKALEGLVDPELYDFYKNDYEHHNKQMYFDFQNTCDMDNGDDVQGKDMYKIAIENLIASQKEINQGLKTIRDNKNIWKEEWKNKQQNKTKDTSAQVKEKKQAPKIKTKDNQPKVLTTEVNSNSAVESNMENKELRQNILKALDTGLEILTNLPEAEQTERIKWVIKSVEDAKNKAEANPNLMFDVGAQGKNQAEGIPVDDLIEELGRISSEKKSVADKLIERKKGLASMRRLANDLKKKYEETLQKLGLDQGSGTDPEHQQKIAWHSVYNELSVSKQTLRGKLRQWVDATRQSWAKSDKEAGNNVSLNPEGDDYIIDSDNFPLQTGEALRQVTEKIITDGAGEFDQIALDKINQELKRINGVIESLQLNSKKYFDIRPEMTGEEQHWRTELEAKLISLDIRSTGNVEQDYELAMEAMNKRREIVLVPEPKTPEEEPKNPQLQLEHNPTSAGELEVIKSKKPEEPEKPQSQIEYDPTKYEIIKVPEVEKGKKKIKHIIDLSEVVTAYAWREANTKLTAMQNEYKLKFIENYQVAQNKDRSRFYKLFFAIKNESPSNFLKSVYLNLGEKGYLMKFYYEALAAISNNKNLHAEIEARLLGISKVKSEKQDVNYEILDSVIEEYTKEVVDADEKGELIQDDEVNLALGQLFADYATSNMTRENFNHEVEVRIISLLKNKNKQFGSIDRGSEAKGLMYANDFFSLAQSYREQFSGQTDELTKEFGDDQKTNIELQIKAELALDIQLGLKQKDLHETKPKSVLKWYEKFVDFTENVPILNKVIANPVTYGVVGGVVGSFVGKGVARFAAGTGLVTLAGVAPWLAPILVGAGFGGTVTAMRRSRNLQYDRGMDLHRMTLGVEVDAGAKRTNKIREFNYNIKRAEDCRSMLLALMTKDELTEAGKQDVADVIARIELEKEKSVDLIGVSEIEGEKYKTKLIAMKDLKVALKNLEFKFGLSRDEEKIRKLINDAKIVLIENIESNDKNFDVYRRWQMSKSGIIGAGLGSAAGAVGQWAAGEMRSLLGYTPKTESALEHLAHYIKGDGESSSGVMEHLSYVDGKILDGNGRIITDNLPVDPNTGEIDASAITELKGQGILVNETHSQVTENFSVANKLQEGLAKNPRADWHDEAGKKMSSFFNRLIEHEGKQQMFYLSKDSSGNVTVDASKILENLSANAQNALKEFGTNPDGSVDSKLAGLRDQLLEWANKGELAKHLKVAIFPTEADNKAGLSYLTEATDASGKINFGEAISKLFETANSLKDGNIPFRFGELRIIDNDGASHVLATITGKDIDPTIMAEIVTDKFNYGFDMLNPTDHSWDVPPVLPFDPRRPLEGPRKKDKDKDKDNTPNDSGSSDGGTEVIRKQNNVPDNLPIGPRVKGQSTADGKSSADQSPLDNEGEVGESITDDQEDETKEETIEQKKRLTLDELIKEISINEKSLSKKERELAHEWLMGLSSDEIKTINYDNKKISQLQKLIKITYFDHRSNDFYDTTAKQLFEKLSKRIEQILAYNPDLKDIFTNKNEDVIDTTATSV